MDLSEKIPALLIANRGEIAVRVIRTAKAHGIRTIAVYHDLDAAAPHVMEADEAHRLEGEPPTSAYLDIDQIVTVAKQAGAAAVHPGYGFLSENAKFTEALAAENIAFVGPNAHAIRAMGDKIESKKLAAKAGVSTVPGTEDAITDVDEAVKIATGIGYPVMIKASAGGGGKGMRIAHDEDEVRTGFVSAVGEARSSFGDDRVFIEKYIVKPRHIEIQVLGDKHGTVVHLGERECSIQRRHQKIIEEAPSAFITPAIRDAMGRQAVALAQAVDYDSAGTVEFIVDQDRNFYFLEMNTRLQVEHPVTENVTGLDLVEMQLIAAAGEKLPLTQTDVTIAGHSIEMRICAEDPDQGFMPAIGRIRRLRVPDGVRFDSGIVEGGTVAPAFDSMLAKLIVEDETREGAVAKAIEALKGLVVLGVTTNAGYLKRILEHPAFLQGDTHTGFIAEHEEALKKPGLDTVQTRAVLAAAVLGDPAFVRLANEPPAPLTDMGEWRVNR